MKNANTVNEPVQKIYMDKKEYLNDVEILSVIAKCSIETARSIMIEADFSFSQLAKWPIAKWLKFDGMGISKVSAIIAAFEMHKRRSIEVNTNVRIITNSADIYSYVKPYLMDITVEHFYVLFLNRANKIIRLEQMSSGGTNGTVADPRLIFKKALEHNATTIALIHNHPSGNTRPSEQDRKLTARMKAAGDNLEINVIDHLIFTENSYFSFSDEGLL